MAVRQTHGAGAAGSETDRKSFHTGTRPQTVPLLFLLAPCGEAGRQGEGARCRHAPRAAALPAAGSHVSLGSHLTAGARGLRRPGARLRPGQRQTLEVWSQAPRHRSQPCGQGPAVPLKRHKLLPPDRAQEGTGREGTRRAEARAWGHSAPLQAAGHWQPPDPRAPLVQQSGPLPQGDSARRDGGRPVSTPSAGEWALDEPGGAGGDPASGPGRRQAVGRWCTGARGGGPAVFPRGAGGAMPSERTTPQHPDPLPWVSRGRG